MPAYFAHVGAFDPKAKSEDINGWLDRFDACVQLNGIASMAEGTDDVAPEQGVDVGAVEQPTNRPVVPSSLLRLDQSDLEC